MSAIAKKPSFTPTQTNYSIKEAAEYLRVSVNTVRNLIDRKLLRASKALRHVRIPGEDVETFIERTSH